MVGARNLRGGIGALAGAVTTADFFVCFFTPVRSAVPFWWLTGAGPSIGTMDEPGGLDEAAVSGSGAAEAGGTGVAAGVASTGGYSAGSLCPFSFGLAAGVEAAELALDRSAAAAALTSEFCRLCRASRLYIFTVFRLEAAVGMPGLDPRVTEELREELLELGKEVGAMEAGSCIDEEESGWTVAASAAAAASADAASAGESDEAGADESAAGWGSTSAGSDCAMPFATS